MEAIITALITGGLALAGVIITNVSGNRKMQSQLEKQTEVGRTRNMMKLYSQKLFCRLLFFAFCDSERNNLA